MNHHMAQKHAKYNYKGTTPKSHYTSIYHNNFIVSDIMFVYNKLWSVAFFTRYACKPWDGSYPYLVSFPFYIYIIYNPCIPYFQMMEFLFTYLLSFLFSEAICCCL